MSGIKSDLTNKTWNDNIPLREFEVSNESGYQPSIDEINAVMASRNMPPIDPKIFQQNKPTQNINNLEKQVVQARQAKISGKEILTDKARERIKLLCGVSRKTKIVKIDDNNSFVLKTLKGKEQREAIKMASEFDNSVESPFEIRKQLLARSISMVSDIDIDMFLNNNTLEAKLEFVEELDEVLLIKLYNEYLLLVKETQEKYFPKNEEEIKEVVNDLKK